jgi:hypothetical protein
VHSTYTNHVLRNDFRRRFNIDCVLFRPDQAAELHTDVLNDTWLLVTDWDAGEIVTTFSRRLVDAKFTILIDEEFDLAIWAACQRVRPTAKLRPQHSRDHQMTECMSHLVVGICTSSRRALSTSTTAIPVSEDA